MKYLNQNITRKEYFEMYFLPRVYCFFGFHYMYKYYSPKPDHIRHFFRTYPGGMRGGLNFSCSECGFQCRCGKVHSNKNEKHR